MRTCRVFSIMCMRESKLMPLPIFLSLIQQNLDTGKSTVVQMIRSCIALEKRSVWSYFGMNSMLTTSFRLQTNPGPLGWFFVVWSSVWSLIKRQFRGDIEPGFSRSSFPDVRSRSISSWNTRWSEAWVSFRSYRWPEAGWVQECDMVRQGGLWNITVFE